MITLTWRPIHTYSLPEQDIDKPWLMALEDFGAAATYLKLKATGEWVAMPGLPSYGPMASSGRPFLTIGW